jgi:hypothetical protein
MIRNTGNYTQVQFSSTATLAALLRFSFSVQQCWKLFSGTAIMENLLRYNNTSVSRFQETKKGEMITINDNIK